ncbi:MULTISPECIES: SlyX family protein [unclassified Rheinheimera]|jgi:SlyX protein|uniref:SlyX family protein n=1 Tax=unclassified Rheinheimera TaxID=115860 RepID=UPI0021F8D970|nr:MULTISPECIES: SlyX family protein [unclassified Rheinheimera]MBU0912965.1 SlyX family protein [Gammaproteobacteria bacterium]CAI3791064.1 Protein SlyX [Rheinheimera sp. MM224]HJS14973.1 SlyX family protein [Rheinheimera sp.]
MTEQVVELQQQLIDLESKLAFQEDVVQTLNDELHEHQKSIEKLQRQVMLLAEKISKGNDSGILRVDEEPPPPHY